jgi:hypothetical protein
MARTRPACTTRRHDKLDDAERRQRPTTVRPLTFDDLATPGPTFRNTRHLVPIESVQPGDDRSFAAPGARFGEPVIDLDPTKGAYDFLLALMIAEFVTHVRNPPTTASPGSCTSDISFVFWIR